MFSFVSSVHFLTITTLVAFLVLPSSTVVDDRYGTCTSVLLSCGNNVSRAGYPFWGDGRPRYCGLPALQFQCRHREIGDHPTLTIESKDETPYHVLSMKHFGSECFKTFLALPSTRILVTSSRLAQVWRTLNFSTSARVTLMHIISTVQFRVIRVALNIRLIMCLTCLL
ncbi:hypothetical protein RND81_11G132100 [Saponaria officinalis]|uniref:Wall-associated receptor kinase galacturonan-binding domain-containing protein n=1 Tax=Saponaria officinalis TaxID=3572 RepID=A0AAW1HLL7_SAPOF